MPGIRISVKVPNSNGVAPGSTAVWKLPIGRRYHALALQYSGTTFNLTHMTDIRVRVNGEVIHQLSATDRDMINQFDGRAAAAGILLIPFDRFGLYTQSGEEATAIQTGSADPTNGIAITLFELEIDIAAGAVAPVVNVTAIQSDNDPAAPGPGLIMRTLRYSRTFGVSGINEIADLPKGTEGPKYRWLNRTFIRTTSTLDLEIRRSGYELFQRTAGVNSRIQLDGVRVPQANVFVFDPTEEGYDFTPVPLVQSDGVPYQDFRYRLNMTAAETVTLIQEYLGSLAG